ncbi:hypothetical protein JS532_09270 [Bifidobacterium callimiconis]|uniref:hypothetical protein n=1 Tax=Bifidobacterium callimiconis TaxID=2306973 RepID=UPI001BDC8F6D|nr:hypothetical protein [Bifidobacterium callimiconis]MBT1177744.1 hypothetical protein [Bifidobacterium callimiconis]
MALMVLAFILPAFNLFLGDFLAVLMFVASLLATVQIHRARNAYSPNESAQSVKLRAPRGWVISIILLVLGSLATLDFISKIVIGAY